MDDMLCLNILGNKMLSHSLVFPRSEARSRWRSFSPRTPRHISSLTLVGPILFVPIPKLVKRNPSKTSFKRYEDEKGAVGNGSSVTQSFFWHTTCGAWFKLFHNKVKYIIICFWEMFF
ncbi:N utilization substance protein B homolog [Striga asiatica]|uniref:N utilization substance protein B homolog n=1 Tax=Striga asiatica TaxID=4170 RepID=A0A5A7Q4C2_STRAF|nr:N utilization substance protein B homolog [Striga asiatica]